jgi:hypothetical protein
MQIELDDLVGQYLEWLKDRTSLRGVDDWVEITTPYLDRHNDYLQIYVKKEDGEYLLTDDGYVIQDLKLAGCDLESDKRQALLKQTLNGFNIQRDGEALITYASNENFPVRKHSLLQAMLAVDDLFYLAQPTVSSLFFEDVSQWLDAHNIRYFPDVKLTGRSGFDYQFEFVIPKSANAPERILSTINHPDRTSTQKLFTAWLDTKDARPAQSQAFAVINDTVKPAPHSILRALEKYDIRTIPWSRREEAYEALAA